MSATFCRRTCAPLLAVFFLVGCGRDWDPNRIAAGSGADHSGAAMAAAFGGTAIPTPLIPGAPNVSLSFARLPDHGDLVGYPRQRTSRHEGAYTWHRADVSELHALRSIATGTLRITTPTGEVLAFEYERHVEHPTGDWTWVGRLRDAVPGHQAILTFGAQAVFGSIPQRQGAALRLTTRDGGAWLVESDPLAVAAAERRVLRPEKPDYVLPPQVMPQVAPRWQSSGTDTGATTGEASKSTAATAGTTVDVLVGYTPGFAAAYGGASQASTRINFLVQVANEGFQNSQVDARVRLVHAMEVNYPDATANGQALEKLTGYDTSKTGSARFVQPDPAFDGLRQARETYGADLVTLLRKFNDPENDGCGVAWLIGGGQTEITQAYEYFGYSVVSDGQDQGADGKTYFCREETLVHEWGHNMGSAHDIETAKGDDGVLQANEYGRYTYSFGYKTAPGSGDFYTIMAYPDKRDTGVRQQPYRVFSNPTTTFCGGFTCGTVGADNARSLRQTTPVIAQFRASVVASPPPLARGAGMDVNADGKSDILLRGGDSAFAYWRMNGATREGDAYLGTAAEGFRFIGLGNFDGAGGTDVLWADGSRIRIWFNDGTGRYVVYPIASYGNGWEPFATTDVNGDGKSDILFRGGSAVAYWRMDSTVVAASAYAGDTGPGFRLVGSGDLDGDGLEDLVWADTSSIKMWLNTPAGYASSVLGNYGGGWSPVGVGDVDGDGIADIIFEGGSAVAYWRIVGGQVTASSYLGDGGTGFRVFAIADYDGNGRADIGWNDGTSIKVWVNQGGAQYAPYLVGNYVCCWRPEGGLTFR